MMATTSGNTDVLVYHGGTDAGGVSVDELTVPVTGLIPSLRYGEFSSYQELATMDYELGVNSPGEWKYGGQLWCSSFYSGADGFLHCSAGFRFGE
ncbi:MAG: hypothetical protein U5L96_13395 [Owenweeksia sp.]|nr:hypothetical protein [Owenweeksia sp.]